ncbi:MAG: hypothetical protein AMXMBFR13_14500 [Phycisphaerae bacterium]
MKQVSIAGILYESFPGAGIVRGFKRPHAHGNRFGSQQGATGRVQCHPQSSAFSNRLFWFIVKHNHERAPVAR